MAYTETRTVGYGSRVGNSFKQIGSGFLLFIAGTVLLWWNEGNYKKTADMLEEARQVTVEMNDITKVSPEFEGQLVWANGTAKTEDVLQDDQFPVSGNYMHLKRDVEYYQWVEHKHEERKDKVGGGEEIKTTYTYSKEWCRSPQSSAGYKEAGHDNTVKIEVENKSYDATNVAFGAYTFPDFFINSIGGYTAAPVTQSEEQLAEQQRLEEQARQDSIALAEGRVVPQRNIQKQDPYLVNGNEIYYGRSSNSPEIGDVRITFTKVDPEAAVSILGKVTGTTFAKWKAKNGKTFSRLESGKVMVNEMYDNAESENDMLKWGLRLLGIILVISGLKMIFNFLVILLKVLPFLASIMNFGVGLVCTVLGIAWSLIVIGVAWLFYRPLIGVIILAVAGGLIAYFVMRGKNKQPAVEPAPAGPQPQQPQFGGQQMPQQPQQQWGGQQMPQQPQQPQQQWGGQQAPQQGQPWGGQQVPQQPQQGQPWGGQQVPQQPQQGQPWNGQAPQDSNGPNNQ